MPLQLYNSISRHKERFEPLDPERVTLYACGPTVYNPPHIGNARAAVVYDLLYRVLRRHYANVVYARNITDVDDKINAAARAEGV
ncbi:MAG: cysteine--tRNA ligase, partial [Gammaproteobacteria bacterium]